MTDPVTHSPEPTAVELDVMTKALWRLAEGCTSQEDFISAFKDHAGELPCSKMEKAFQAAKICREKFPS